MKKPLLILSLCSTLLSAQSEWLEQVEKLPFLMNTFADYQNGKKRVSALKGILIQLEEDWRVLFDTETLRVSTAYQGDIEWDGTAWTGSHGALLGIGNQEALFTTNLGSAWADEHGSFEDRRPIPSFGNIPHGTFLGHYRHGQQTTLHYSVHGTEIWETFLIREKCLTRVLRMGARPRDLELLVADENGNFTLNPEENQASSPDGLHVLSEGQLSLQAKQSRLTASIPQGENELTVRIAYSRANKPILADIPNFQTLTSGGAGISPQKITTSGKISSAENKSYLTDIVTYPKENPWASNLRFGGFDFIDENSAALCSWNGEVWIVEGLKGDWKNLSWKRIATGLFETLGLKVVDGQIYVNGRDQITKLIDLNADSEIDHFQVFNRDVLISSNFHEFAFDLVTDQAGNFYFSKGGPVKGGGRGFDTILPHHGIVAKVSPDGKTFEVIATGLRAPGGIGIGPNGEISTGENEGTWQPSCKINFAKAEELPVFFGTEALRHSLTNNAYQAPLLYLPMQIDNSGASQVWVPEYAKFGLKTGVMLHLSYGKSTIFRVFPSKEQGKTQAAVIPLPIDLLSSAMRARFHPDGSLYVLGFRAWQSNATTEAAFQRIRYNETQPNTQPEEIEFSEKKWLIRFPVLLDQALVEDPKSWTIQRWNYVRGPQYGSGEFSVDQPDLVAETRALEAESQFHRKRDTVEIESIDLLEDGKTIELELKDPKPSMSLSVAYDLESTQGDVFIGEIHATLHAK